MTDWVKSRRGAPRGYFATEAAGLRWLADADGAPVVAVRGYDEGSLTLERLETVAPSAGAAQEFGALLARTHGAGAPGFASLPPGAERAWFGPLGSPQAMPAGSYDRLGEYLSQARIRPMMLRLGEAGRLDREEHARLDALATRLEEGEFDDGEPPARVHGDLWAGNVLFTPSGVVLIDPAAHGGHRLEDIGLLFLFGVPHLEDITAGYTGEHALRDDWRGVLGLFQLYPVLVHLDLFGEGYRAGVHSILSDLESRT